LLGSSGRPFDSKTTDDDWTSSGIGLKFSGHGGKGFRPWPEGFWPAMGASGLGLEGFWPWREEVFPWPEGFFLD